jgi:hypothetical protein
VSREEIPIRAFGGKLRGLEGRLSKAMLRGMRAAAIVLRAGLEETIAGTSPPPVDTGAYRAAWNITRTEQGARVGNESLQALFVEIGRRPGPVSAAGYQNLIDWVRRKGLATDEREIKSIAWAVKEKIEKLGVKPRYVMRNALEQHKPAMAAALSAALTEAGSK